MVLEEEDFDIFVLEIEDEITLAALTSLAAFAASLRLLRVRFGMSLYVSAFARVEYGAIFF